MNIFCLKLILLSLRRWKVMLLSIFTRKRKVVLTTIQGYTHFKGKTQNQLIFHVTSKYVLATWKDQPLFITLSGSLKIYKQDLTISRSKKKTSTKVSLKTHCGYAKYYNYVLFYTPQTCGMVISITVPQ